MDEQQQAIMLRYLQDTCSPEEKQSFEEWLHQSADNRQQFYETRLLWYASRIEYFGSKEPLEKALATFTNNISQSHQQQRRPIYRLLMRYAAIAIGIIGLSWLLFLLTRPVNNTTPWLMASVANTDSSRLVTLPDSTRVWLNSNSRIFYPAQFSGDQRTVSLEGEAYLEVTHDPVHPFILSTSTIQVKVLGTTFNLQAYPGENQAEAVLVQGKIAIADQAGKDLNVLAPGQLALYQKNNQTLTIKQVNPNSYTAWRNGNIALYGASLQTIASRLAGIYQANISIGKTLTDTARYNFIFSKKKPLSEVMEMLSFIAPIHYEVKGKEVLITNK
jgi:ferric-dicitrate binding protein FerR (iron transport regulator)